MKQRDGRHGRAPRVEERRGEGGERREAGARQAVGTDDGRISHRTESRSKRYAMTSEDPTSAPESNFDECTTQIPILDIRQWESDPKAFAEQLRSACHNIGFFLLKHDLSPDLVRAQLAECRQFFDRPVEEKLTISYDTSPSFRGYMEVGVENTGGIVDVREQVEFATEYPEKKPSCSSFSISRPYERLKSPTNPYPDSTQPSLRQCSEEYVGGALDVARRLREAMCIALGLDRTALNYLFGEVGKQDSSGLNNEDPLHWVMKLISYPPATGASTKEQGVGAHTDTNFLTLVLQDYSGGLQVHSNGVWIDVPAKYGPDLFVCNLGEQAEIISKGYFLATPHRVMRNTGREPRISVALFYNPKLSSVVEPICTDTNGEEEQPKQWKNKLEWERSEGKSECWKMKGNAHPQCVGANTFKSLARSHPEVFAKNHPDLVLLANGEIVPVSRNATPS